MRQLHTSAFVVLLSAFIALSPASAFGGKKKNSDAKPAASSGSSGPVPPQPADSSTAPTTTPNLDDILSQPVTRGPLQGGVQEEGTGEGTNLQGGTDTSGGGRRLNGNAQDGAAGGLPMQPKTDNTTVLKGNASLSGGKLGGSLQDDPDREDNELMVEWDRWRNRFLRAVQLQVQAGVNHPDDWEEDSRPKVVVDPYTGRPMIMPRFPMGTEAWFSCDVTSDKKVKNLQIVKPSGYPAYDKAVIEGVRALEGTSLLQYPTGSHRLIVNETAGIRTATTSNYQYHHFGDVERVHNP